MMRQRAEQEVRLHLLSRLVSLRTERNSTAEEYQRLFGIVSEFSIFIFDRCYQKMQEWTSRHGLRIMKMDEHLGVTNELKRVIEGSFRRVIEKFNASSKLQLLILNETVEYTGTVVANANVLIKTSKYKEVEQTLKSSVESEEAKMTSLLDLRDVRDFLEDLKLTLSSDNSFSQASGSCAAGALQGGGATSGPGTPQGGGATSGPGTTQGGGATSGPDTTQGGGATSGPGTSQGGGATSGPGTTQGGGATSGPDTTQGGGATSGPGTTQGGGATNASDTSQGVGSGLDEGTSDDDHDSDSSMPSAR